jgi:hypothetical protein
MATSPIFARGDGRGRKQYLARPTASFAIGVRDQESTRRLMEDALEFALIAPGTP